MSCHRFFFLTLQRLLRQAQHSGLVRAFNRAVLSNLEVVLDYEANLQEIAGKRAEHKEGVEAFLEKRKPAF